jgi:hypothetical protein
MSDAEKKPSFTDFSRWLASRLHQQGIPQEQYDQVSAGARSARNEFVQARREARAESTATPGAYGSMETLLLLAAADADSSLPPEIVTPRGFRITLAYEESSDAGSSLGVLVTCPTELSASLEGQMAYLWCDTERFELGQFDADGKALGALPEGAVVTAEDFASGRVKLEVPV